MFELNKCFWTATKIHQVPVNQSPAINEVERAMEDNSEYNLVCEINSLETQTFSKDDKSPEEWDVEDEAKKCYQKLLESKYLWKYRIADLNTIHQPPSYLAMVTTKIQGSTYLQETLH